MWPTSFPQWSALILIAGGLAFFEALRFFGLARYRPADPRLPRAGFFSLLVAVYAVTAAVQYATPDPGEAYTWRIRQYLAGVLVPAAYLMVAESLLQQRMPRLRTALLGAGVLCVLLTLVNPAWTYSTDFRLREIAWLQLSLRDYAAAPLALAFYLLSLLALLGATWMTLTSLRRRQARTVGVQLLAFGIIGVLDMTTASGLFNLPFLTHFAYLFVIYATNRSLLSGYFELLEENEHLVAQRERLLTNISHELRTPLGVALGYLELLERRGRRLGDTEAQFVMRARRALLDETELIEQLIEYSRLSNPREEFEPKVVGLRELVEHASERLTLLASRKGIQIRNHVPEGLTVEVDPKWFTLAVKNLIHNAIKYSGDDKGMLVEVRADRGSTMGAGYVDLVVIDYGAGIPAEEQSRIFERFEQGSAGQACESDPGLGIGLSLVRDVAQGHSGEISLHSEPGLGSEFRIRLPVRAQADDAEFSPSSPIPARNAVPAR